jgi:hypothetical protein
MPCPPVCPREITPRDEASPGVIGPDEDICRAYFASDRNKTTVKRSAIRAKDLWAGELSVWRVSALVNCTVEQIVEFIDPLVVRSDDEHFSILGAVKASVLREHRIDGVDERSFSVLDECEIDDAGNKHIAHAHIAICDHLKANITRGDQTFIALQDALNLLFKPGNPLWSRSAD